MVSAALILVSSVFRTAQVSAIVKPLSPVEVETSWIGESIQRSVGRSNMEVVNEGTVKLSDSVIQLVCGGLNIDRINAASVHLNSGP